MRAYSTVGRSRPRNTGACPLTGDLKKRDRAGSQQALLLVRWWDMVFTIREQEE